MIADQNLEAAADMLGDHPVLAFLNTRPMVEGVLQDQLMTDTDVAATLKRLGWSIAFRGPGLLAEARELREEVRRLVADRKAGKLLNLRRLNAFLGDAHSHLRLRQTDGESLVAERIWGSATARQALAPVAEAAAELLATADFNLIRRCEGESCVLWFYDRTRSHQRRWCSMSACGNRNKVAAFRSRNREA